MKNLKEAIFAKFRTEDIVLQYFLIAIFQYLQFVKFEVEKASQSNMTEMNLQLFLGEYVYTCVHVIGQQHCVVI